MEHLNSKSIAYFLYLRSFTTRNKDDILLLNPVATLYDPTQINERTLFPVPHIANLEHHKILLPSKNTLNQTRIHNAVLNP